MHTFKNIRTSFLEALIFFALFGDNNKKRSIYGVFLERGILSAEL